MRRAVLVALVLGAASVWGGCATGITLPSGDAGATKGSLVGFVISDVGGDVEYWFEYGPTTAYGSETQHRSANIGANVHQLVADTATGLTRSTVYHYRLCAQDSQQKGGPGCGVDQHFETQAYGCGDTVTTDFTLVSDLNCEPHGTGPGLRIGASGITIDLNGHKLYGGRSFDEPSAPAIDNSGGYDDVTIRNGTLSLWGENNPVVISGADRNRILRVTVNNFGGGVLVTGGTGLEIRHSDLGDGIVLRSLSDAVVADSALWGSGHDALLLDGTSSTRVVRNRIGRGSLVPGPPIYGIAVNGNVNVVRYNVVDSWTGAGIGVLGGSGNRVISNELSNPLTEQSPGDGIFVGPFTAGTRVRDNFAHHNNDDGIEVAAKDARLGGNRADDNGDFGIDAVAGVTDLGGNTAAGNGNPLQCRNVFCP